MKNLLAKCQCSAMKRFDILFSNRQLHKHFKKGKESIKPFVVDFIVSGVSDPYLCNSLFLNTEVVKENIISLKRSTLTL